MTRQSISVSPIAGALGAEIAGVNLSLPLSDRAIGEIRAALLDHLVIFFHDQHLTPEQQLEFGRRFGLHRFSHGRAQRPAGGSASGPRRCTGSRRSTSG